MARSIRIEYAGAYYHVLARGNRQDAIFLDADDCRFFLKTLADACGMTGWRVHAWVLMGNHYHLLIETPEANLVSGMQWLQNAYTRRFNTRHGVWGRVFGDRYKAIVVEGKNQYYYETLLDYIHLNPVRAGLIKPGARRGVMDYEWSSISGAYALPARQRPGWMAVEAGLAAFGLADTASGRRRFVERLDRRAREEGKMAGVVSLPEGADARCSHLKRGWYWGSQDFSERLLKAGKKVLGAKRGRGFKGSLEKKAHDLQRAEELLAEGLAAAGLEGEDLALLPGSDPRKVVVARAIWERTTVPQGWLAERLEMRSAANVSQQLRRERTGEEGGKLPARLSKWVGKLGKSEA